MRFSDILLEYNRDQTVKNYGQKVLAAALQDNTINFEGQFGNMITTRRQIAADAELQKSIIDYIMSVIERSDPTKNKIYSQALTKMYCVGDTPIEDFATISDDLIKFDKLKIKKKIKPEHADFMRFKSARDFMNVISQYPDPEGDIGSQDVQVAKIPEGLDYKIVYGGLDNQLRITSDILVVMPENEAASQFWARGYPSALSKQTNKWCTGRPEQCLFSSYKRDGDLYIIIPSKRNPNDEKYQFYFSSGGRRNEFAYNDNRHLSDEDLDKLVARFPVLTKIFGDRAISNNIVPLIPPEYKQQVGKYAETASQQLDAMLEKFTPRIARFGFTELRNPQKYGIDISQEAEESLIPAIEEFIAQFRETIKGEFWNKIATTLGSERNSDKIEMFLNGDKTIEAILNNSKASKLIKQLEETEPAVNKLKFDHLRDIIVRDPVFRICITQIPKLYVEFLNQLNGKQVNESVNANYNTARSMAKELHADVEDYSEIAHAGATTGAGHQHNRDSLKNSIQELHAELEQLGFEYDPQGRDYLRPLTIDIDEGGMKDIAIGKQDYDEMTPRQFRKEYSQSRDDWMSQNKKVIKPSKPKVTRSKPANTIEAYVEYYDKNDRKQFGTIGFPNEVVARKWAEKHNATIHSIIQMHKVEEAKKKDADDLWPLGDHEQEFTSAKTSINVSKLPSTFGKLDKMNLELKGKVIADIGGGRYDNAVTWAAERGGKLYVYDPFNRSTEHNKSVIAKISHGKADIATCNNVLNVIKEPVNRVLVIQQVENVLKNGGTAYFLTYEGDKSGKGKITQQGGSYQNNLPTKEYLDEVHAIFGNATLKNGMIVAVKGGVNESQDFMRIKELIGKL